MAGDAQIEVGTFLVDQLLSLQHQGLGKSCMILGDMMLTNTLLLGIPNHSVDHCKLLLVYADSLYHNKQYRRALHYCQKALKSLSKSDSNNQEGVPVYNEGEIKWKMYQCYIELKEYQEALDILLSVPVVQRSARTLMCVAKLYHHFKKDSSNAMMYYRMVLIQCPFAVEAVIGLLSLGTSLSQLTTILKQQPHSLVTIAWLSVWLKAQENISLYHYTDAVKEFDNLTKMGFTLSPEMNSQVGWCMTKLFRKTAALELFKTARTQDPFILNYMDTYARILTSKTALPNDSQLADALLLVTTEHFEPWLVKAWSIVRKSTWKEEGSASIPSLNVLLNKIKQVANPLEPAKPEGAFLLGAISVSRQRFEDSISHFHVAIKADPAFFEAYENLLRCYTLCRGYKAAYSAMKMAHKYIKLPVQQFYLEAIVLSTRPETQARARLCLENAIRIDKTFEKAPIALSHALRQDRKVNKAIEMLHNVLEQYQSSSLHAELGKCFELVKKHSDAMQQYELSLRMDPDNREALQGLKRIQSAGARDESNDDHQNNEENDVENEMEGLEDMLLANLGEPLEGVREFGDNISVPIIDFDTDF